MPSALVTSICGARMNATGLSRRAMQSSSWIPSSYGSCVASYAGVARNEHTSLSRELQPCLARRMFLESEGSYHADSESAVIFISIGDHYLGPMRVIRGQYFAGSPRRGWRDRPRSEERRVGKECRSRWSPY